MTMNSIEVEAIDSEPPSLARMEAYKKVIGQNFHKNSILMEKILKQKTSAHEFLYDNDDSSVFWPKVGASKHKDLWTLKFLTPLLDLTFLTRRAWEQQGWNKLKKQTQE